MAIGHAFTDLISALEVNRMYIQHERKKYGQYIFQQLLSLVSYYILKDIDITIVIVVYGINGKKRNKL